MKITIVRTPLGEAPEWVREAWIGLTFPVIGAKQRMAAYGVLTRPRNWFAQVWANLTGKSFEMTGYLVNAKLAVDLLAEHQLEAAAWWREHLPDRLDGEGQFLFDADACEEVSSSADRAV
ncbi:hypothetical protein [Devosia sp. Leaf64]|uniref:hypothetical protein n=1 Tax=Devosia sp. Leaf64 TaxID=1736229 RepID=UPI000714FF89|nr:hypothetical protein [Devosia sp. Leaf64]KQN74304.1 hypothetical protein ASE94_04715 [Devosia sp. Leaf64]